MMPTMSPRWKFAAILLFAIVLPWLPLGTSTNYLLRVINTAILYMILALGLNIVPGFTGLQQGCSPSITI
jgi:branched-chain amino acid transport system permease protein